MLCWTIILIVVLVFSVFIKLFSGWFAKKYEKRTPTRIAKIMLFVDKYFLSDFSMQVLIGIMATFVGVTLSLHMSNIDTQNRDNMSKAEIQKQNIKSVNQLLSLTYNDIAKQLTEYDLFYDVIVESYDTSYDTLKDYVRKKPASIDYLVDNELTSKLIDQEIYLQMLDLRANLYLKINNTEQIDRSEKTIFLRDINKINLYYEYFQRTVYLAFLNITNANTIDDICILMRTNTVWFTTKLLVIDGMEEQEAFNSAIMIYAETYPERLTEDGDELRLELGNMEYPEWLFLKDSYLNSP